jgi:uncharacterized protein (DUF1501 family)
MNDKQSNSLDTGRRRFLQGTGALLAGAALGMTPRARADFTDYRALVCVFLYGGNDSFNMLVPRSTAEYNVYAASRQNLAVAQNTLLPITPSTQDGALYGLHPRMGSLLPLFTGGDLALVANTGPLVRLVTRAEVLDRSAPLPPQLFSHNDQQDQWQTAKGRIELRTGWAGRAADLLADDLAAQRLPMNISYTGTTVFQIGGTSSPYVLSEDGAPSYFVLTDPTAYLYAERRQMFERLLNRSYSSPIARSVNAVHRRSLQYADTANAALARAPALQTAFPPSDLAGQLRAVARAIAVRGELAMQRQVFLVAAGGFDTHDNQNTLQPNLLGDVADSLAAFQAALAEIGMADGVVTFTQSDFGRTLTSNGDGTDHGWGGHQIVMGGPVRGGDIYGTMPRLEIDGPDDAGAGRMIPTQSVDQYAATLLRWFGLTEPQLYSALPNLANFARRDLGFFT